MNTARYCHLLVEVVTAGCTDLTSTFRPRLNCCQIINISPSSEKRQHIYEKKKKLGPTLKKRSSHLLNNVADYKCSVYFGRVIKCDTITLFLNTTHSITVYL